MNIGDLREQLGDCVGDLDFCVKSIVENRDDLRKNDSHKNASALAFDLHSFYSGCERALKLCLKPYNQLPSTSDWHKQLLAVAAEDSEGHPAVISSETAAKMEPFLKFRHFARNAYSWTLEPTKLLDLADGIEEVWTPFKLEVLAFGEYCSQKTESISPLKLPPSDLSDGGNNKRGGVSD